MDVASSTTVPSDEYRHETYLSLQDNTNKFLVHQNGVDDHYFQLYDIEFIEGHDFVRDARSANSNSIILNESAAKGLGIYDFDNAIDSKIIDHESGEAYNLIGIVKDYHQTPLKYKIEPTAFKFNVVRGHISMKINRAGITDDALNENISAMKETWEQLYRDASFDYYFLDERFESLNMEDRYFGKLFYWFTFLSVIISCLGLFGMSLLISEKRQKEIGIRRVFGASPVDILTIFLKGYIGSVLASVVIGSPLGYVLMSIWLSDYAYRTEISFGLVSTANLSIILIFMFTVTYDTIRSSLTNPVTILKD
jgi:putative ABC transport system permease protein